MDGTGRLFAPFAAALPEYLAPEVVSYPVDEPLGIAALADRVDVGDEHIAIVAESFSGPIAIRLAQRLGPRVRVLVLVATFVRRPRRLAIPAALIGPLLFRAPPPRAVVRKLLLDDAASKAEVDEVIAAIELVQPRVLACRMREIAAVDVRDELSTLTCPILYIAGSRDALVGRTCVDEIRRVQPACRFVSVDAPHLVLQTRPIECAALLAELSEPTE
jgi:pimeloyl-ACP methyl ester carboxylesterase